MKNILDFKTLTDFTDYFCDEAACVAHFTASRFRNGEYCPHCRHDKIYLCSNGKRYQCASCKQDFTIRTKTVFGESKLPLRKWYMAIYLLATSGKGISSVQLAKHVGVTQKTGWFMDHRIRSAMKDTKGQLFGTVECDETFVGGKPRNRSNKNTRGRGAKNKTVVFGMRQRDGKTIGIVVPDCKEKRLTGLIEQHVAKGTTVHTDEMLSYRNLPLMGFPHFTVKHGLRQYVMGDLPHEQH